MQRAGPDLDRAVPVLLVKVGCYPQAHSPVGVARSFGRLGVPVHAMVEDRFTPTAVSRYLSSAFVRPTTGREPPRLLLEALLAAARSVDGRSVAVATDDEAAVLLAEHAEELSPHLLLPAVPAGLPRRLADKGELRLLCEANDIPTPRARAPRDRAELLAAAREWGYPVVLKNLGAFSRLDRPAVGATTVVRDEAALLAACPSELLPALLIQEYLPPEHAEDWFTHLCCGPGGEPLAVFTGLKLRSWPPGAGITTRARALPNPPLAELAARLCRQIGYSGVADLDWRLDRRDGRYKLVDFNPRTGAQFRLFETTAGVDVVRALHLSLTGRPVPQGPQLARHFGVGQVDLLSTAVTAWRERTPPADPWPRRGTERAWLCRDDPLPALAEAVRFGGRPALRIARRALSAPLAPLRMVPR
ncbi:ATP-grasp domain-containing protein [Kitasatospora sp. NPDC049258]|uniref:carboxylate--amine ligase n=1 Tax=Kitasatospora sp. NPDC049258 TaxID=3155394 RepID=UPI00344922E2